ncbi:hypothetical protein DTO217A2_2206 [Paecilomyces variotii]|nr:hypothetical protein DTO217A2_2206 [Paecilomyces variotii]
MLALHIALYALLGASLAFAVIELGLSAHIASLYDHIPVPEYDYYNGYTYEVVDIKPPPILDFIIFSSAWSVLITGVAFFLPFFYRQKENTLTTNKWISIGLVAMYFVTCVFWLASFAYIEWLLGGYSSGSSYLDAMIAFAILLWLSFMALFILTIIAICGVLKSDLPGYMPFKIANVDAAHSADPAELEAPEMERAEVAA